MQYNISLYLDKRKSSKKTNNLYPVKLRVYSNITQRTKLYPTGVDLNKKDFDKIFASNTNLRGKLREIKIRLQTIESKAELVAKELHTFTFDSFKKQMFRNKGASINVSYHYANKIKKLTENGQISTASGYDLSLKSINEYIHIKTHSTLKNLTFYDITPDWLNSYENFMLNEKNRSRNTVSIYLRNLRTIFNEAISKNDIRSEIYPFGREYNKYQVPSSTKTKRALSKQQLTTLFNANPNTIEQEKAKDFWFFSYATNGMNIKDILKLKIKNLHDDYLLYFRAKTINTKKSNLKEIKVILNDYAKSIINKYKVKSNNDDDFVFPILSKEDNIVEQERKIKNFTSFVNLHFNKLAKKEDFTFKISTYWARHSFVTTAIRNGAKPEFVSEALNHSSLNVTKNYFAGFEDETKKEFAKKLMNF